MKTLYNIIISPEGDRYNNTKKISGIDMIVNTHIDEKDFKYTNRVGVIKHLPLTDTPFKVGDKVIVHHNVFRKYWSFKGNLRTSANDLENNKFSVDMSQIFAYKTGDSDWKCTEDNIFIEPIKILKHKITDVMNEYVVQQGIVALGALEGSCVGDRVAFTPYSEYIFDIDGRRLYKMKKKDITCKLII